MEILLWKYKKQFVFTEIMVSLIESVTILVFLGRYCVCFIIFSKIPHFF